MAKGVCVRPPGVGDVAGEVVVVDEEATRVLELELAPRQALPWHFHTNFDRRYCLSGAVVVYANGIGHPTAPVPTAPDTGDTVMSRPTPTDPVGRSAGGVSRYSSSHHTGRAIPATAASGENATSGTASPERGRDPTPQSRRGTAAG